jgi:hypothetical protein
MLARNQRTVPVDAVAPPHVDGTTNQNHRAHHAAVGRRRGVRLGDARGGVAKGGGSAVRSGVAAILAPDRTRQGACQGTSAINGGARPRVSVSTRARRANRFGAAIRQRGRGRARRNPHRTCRTGDVARLRRSARESSSRDNGGESEQRTCNVGQHVHGQKVPGMLSAVDCPIEGVCDRRVRLSAASGSGMDVNGCQRYEIGHVADRRAPPARGRTRNGSTEGSRNSPAEVLSVGVQGARAGPGRDVARGEHSRRTTRRAKRCSSQFARTKLRSCSANP